MKPSTHRSKREQAIVFVTILSGGTILLYLSLGIAGVIWPKSGDYLYTFISYLAFFFTILLTITKQILNPRRFFWETLLLGSSYFSIFFLIYYKQCFYFSELKGVFSSLGDCVTVIGFVLVFLDFVQELMAEINHPSLHF